MRPGAFWRPDIREAVSVNRGFDIRRRYTMRRLAIVVLVLCAIAVVPVSVVGADVASPQGYIVVLKPGANPAAVAAEHAVRLGLQVGFLYTQALQGYSALVPADAIDALRNDPRVAYVERDQPVHALTT